MLAGLHKVLVRIGNREDPDQTASSEQSGLGLHYQDLFGRQ